MQRLTLELLDVYIFHVFCSSYFVILVNIFKDIMHLTMDLFHVFSSMLVIMLVKTCSKDFIHVYFTE